MSEPVENEHEHVREVAEAVCRRLGDLVVLSVRFDPHVAVVTVAIGGGVVRAHFTVGVAEEDAVVALAGQLQDHAIEATRGAALPACPGHRHPLAPRAVAGVARWVCPADPGHHSEPVSP